MSAAGIIDCALPAFKLVQIEPDLLGNYMRRNILLCTSMLIAGCSNETEMSKSPVILRALYDSGTSSCYFLFKQDSTFEWFNGSDLGSSTLYQGRYERRDSVIYLDKGGFDKPVKSDRLLLTTKHPDPRGIKGRYLVQIDSGSRVVDSVFIFSIQ